MSETQRSKGKQQETRSIAAQVGQVFTALLTAQALYTGYIPQLSQ